MGYNLVEYFVVVTYNRAMGSATLLDEPAVKGADSIFLNGVTLLEYCSWE